MCDKRSSVRLKLPNGKVIRVDACMRDWIFRLNRSGIETLGCCCGHGRHRKSVVVKDTKGRIIEGITGVPIPRKRRFYVADEDGYYYVPEAEKYWEMLRNTD